LEKKMAERIAVELRGVRGHDRGGQADQPGGAALLDLLLALESLGYRRADVAGIAQEVACSNPGADVGAMVRAALKEIAK
jgi:Holliday junction resolvasome RuvABC DNA-binding subunit